MSGFEQPALWPEDELAALEVDIDEARASPPTAKDLATQLREFNGWTIDKLEILRLYPIGGYVRVAGGGTYIDAFAGQGQIDYRGAPRDGSALIAARSGAFRDLYLFEQDSGSHEQLEAQITRLDDRLRNRCHLQAPADCNVAIPQLLDASEVAQWRVAPVGSAGPGCW